MARRRSSHSLFEIDLSVLLDVISNAAGMMILFACMAMLAKGERATPLPNNAKPLDYPLAYLPVPKNTYSIVLKNNQLYELPAEELLEKIIKINAEGKAAETVELTRGGVFARAEFTSTSLGFRFQYDILNDGGIPLNKPIQVKQALDKLIQNYPSKRYFATVYCWPEDFENYRAIQEYLHEKGVEVGWNPRIHSEQVSADITMAIGEYDDNFSTIKAQ